MRRTNSPRANNEEVEKRIKELITPHLFDHLNFFQNCKLRGRILTLPVMVAAVLTMIWRQVPGVCELTRLICRENFLWERPKDISQQALSKRFLTMPAELFKRVFFSLLPILTERALKRTRPQPESITAALNHFDNIYAADGSTLEAIFRKLKSLQEVAPGTLAGKICVAVDLVTRLPAQIWFTKNALAHDTNFLSDIHAFAKAKTLWIFDRGFYDFVFLAALVEYNVAWIMRLRSGTKYVVTEVLQNSDFVRDQLIQLTGKDTQHSYPMTLRLVQIRYGTKWFSYLTSVTNPLILSALAVADLYRRRWRIEETFATVKRLLGLSYLWIGSENGVLLQVWATFIFYTILVDIGDAVAEELQVPFDHISLEMAFRGIYHFTVAYDKGEATDLIKYLAAPENRDLGVLKRQRKSTKKMKINLSESTP